MMQMEKEFNLFQTSDIGDRDWYHTFPTGDLVWLQGGGIAPLGGSTLPLVGCRKRASTQQDRSFQKETMEKGTDMERYMI